MKTALFLFSLLAPLTFAQVSDAVPATVEGQVVSATTGQPLRKATVQLLRYGEMSIRGGMAISDDAGKFRLGNIPPGSYQISVTRPGYVGENAYRFSGRNWILKLDAGQHLNELAIKLAPQGVIAGYVLDEDGDPFRNANVTLFRAPGGMRKGLVEASHVNSDAEGHFVFAGVAAGRYYVGATGQHQIFSSPQRPSREQQENYVLTYYPNSLELAGAVALDVLPASEFRSAEIRLRKARTFRISGKLVTPANLQEMALVLVSGDGKGSSNSLFGRILQGSFEFNNVLPGSYLIRSTDPQTYNEKTGEYLRLPLFCRYPVTVRDEDVNDITLEFQPGVRVSGTVNVEGGAPLEPAPSLVFQLIDGNTRAIRISESGGFELSNLAPDQYSLYLSGLAKQMYVKSIRAGGQETSLSLLDLTAGDPGQIDVLLSPNAAEVRGTVRDDKGEPVPGGSIWLWSKTDRPPMPGGADENGIFQFGNLAPGDYFIAAWESHEFRAADVRSSLEGSANKLTIREGAHETVDITLQP